MRSPALADGTTGAAAPSIQRPVGVTDPVAQSPTPTGVLATVLGAELVTAAALIAASTGQPAPTPADLATTAYLAGLGIATTTIAVRRTVTRSPIISPASVDFSPAWTVPAALLLHPALTAALVTVLLVHPFRPASRASGVLRRQVLNIDATVLACLAARAAYTTAGGPLTNTPAQTAWPPTAAVLLAVLCFACAHHAVLAATSTLDTTARCGSAPRLACPATRDQALLTIASSSLGWVTAAALTVHPLLGLFVVPAACCLHRAVLARHLEDAGRFDGKTGLLTAAAWHTQAHRVLHNRGPGARAWAVLVVDLDHFKAVNDNHGHLAGDSVLVAVADALRAEVRDGDLVGRFGGDEFVVLLTGHDEHRNRHDTTGLLAVADRIRSRVAALRVEVSTPHGPATLAGLSVSIGGTPLPEDGPELQALFRLADTALYAAKRAGRDTVRVMPPAQHLGHCQGACPAAARHDLPPSGGTARP